MYRHPSLTRFAVHLSGLLCCLFLFARIQSSLGAQVTVAWDANQEPDIAGYNLYYRAADGPLQKIDAGSATFVVVTSLQPTRTYFFYATAYNTAGLESEPSDTISYTVPNSLRIRWEESPLPGIIGYNFYYGPVGSPASKIPAAGNTFVTLTNLVPGVACYFFPAGYNILGKETEAYPIITFTPPHDSTLLPEELFIPRSSSSISAGAVSAGADYTSLGDWKGRYGSDGWEIPRNGEYFPPTVVPVISGAKTWIWTDPALDHSGLQHVDDNNRIASALYSSSSFTIRLPFADYSTHRLSVYCLDFQNAGLQEAVEIVDADTDALLARQTIANFTDGVYLLFDVQGRVTVRIRRIAGEQAVMSGLFFD